MSHPGGSIKSNPVLDRVAASCPIPDPAGILCRRNRPATPLAATSSLKPYAMSLAAIIFDCDGTLADTMPVHFEAWQATLAATTVWS